MYSYCNQILSKHQCGSQQGHSTQHSLLLMVEKLKKKIDNSGIGRMPLTDLYLTVGDMIYYLQS